MKAERQSTNLYLEITQDPSDLDHIYAKMADSPSPRPDLSHEELLELELYTAVEDLRGLRQIHQELRAEQRRARRAHQHLKTLLRESVANERRLREMVAKLEESRRCKVCFTSQATVLFLVCRHVVACKGCAAMLKQCPQCKNSVEPGSWIFISI